MAVNLLAAGGYGALLIHFIYGEKTPFHLPLALYVALPTLPMLIMGLSKQRRQELFQQPQIRRLPLWLLAGSLMAVSPVVPVLPLALTFSGHINIWDFLWAIGSHGLGLALLIGVLVCVFRLRRNAAGSVTLASLGLIHGYVSADLLGLVGGGLGALFFYPLLPRPEAASPSSNS